MRYSLALGVRKAGLLDKLVNILAIAGWSVFGLLIVLSLTNKLGDFLFWIVGE